MTHHDFLHTLETTIDQRLRAGDDSSYTVRLANAGIQKVAQKVGEEGVEVVVAALAEGPERVTSEAADLLYHLLLLLRVQGLSLADVTAELERRHKA